jgi:hypothetical protein
MCILVVLAEKEKIPFPGTTANIWSILGTRKAVLKPLRHHLQLRN